jgi:hypothetical protein
VTAAQKAAAFRELIEEYRDLKRPLPCDGSDQRALQHARDARRRQLLAYFGGVEPTIDW